MHGKTGAREALLDRWRDVQQCCVAPARRSQHKTHRDFTCANLESSAVGMFVYALAKGAQLGYLPHSYLAVAQIGWTGILSRFAETDDTGDITITSTVKEIDLGNAPSHYGSYTYCTTAPIVSNDPKEVAVFMIAASEIEQLAGHHGPK